MQLKKEKTNLWSNGFYLHLKNTEAQRGTSSLWLCIKAELLKILRTLAFIEKCVYREAKMELESSSLKGLLPLSDDRSIN